MMNRFKLIAFCGLLALFAGFALFGATPTYAKTVELNYSIFFPATHGHTLLATEWAKEVEKRNQRRSQNQHVSRSYFNTGRSDL